MGAEFYIYCGVFAFIAYLIGGINAAILISKVRYGQDIRTLGSGNPGFTNFKRVFGLNGWAVFVMLSDIIKAMIPVCIAMLVFGETFDMGQFGAAFTGLFAMLGHCFPVWYGFKGGKAFMTGFGTIWFVDWRMTLIAMAVFLLLLGATKYMSVSSCVSSVTCPVMLAILGAESVYVIIISAASALLVVVRHKENFKKLIKGTESKFTLKKKESMS
jgi:glycerol-3-phosphate acyltransferase PlsY